MVLLAGLKKGRLVVKSSTTKYSVGHSSFCCCCCNKQHAKWGILLRLSKATWKVRKPTVFSVDFDRQFPLSDRLVIYDFWYAVGLLVRLTEKSENQHFYSLGDRSKKRGTHTVLMMSDWFFYSLHMDLIQNQSKRFSWTYKIHMRFVIIKVSKTTLLFPFTLVHFTGCATKNWVSYDAKCQLNCADNIKV